MTVAKPDLSNEWDRQKLRNYFLNDFFRRAAAHLGLSKWQ